VAVRCVTGEGGSGKTRLAIELCELAEGAGWDAGFVTFDELTRFAATTTSGAGAGGGRRCS
jgi:Ni2+-binding GTPase involved in maturation of urease and hydrogenase